MLEAPVAILALCGPAINQLVARAVKYRSLSSLFTSRNLDSYESGDMSAKRSIVTSSGGLSKGGAASGSTTAIAKPDHYDDGEEEADIPMGSIGVTRSVEVARYRDNYSDV